jgi:hypothetical protein
MKASRPCPLCRLALSGQRCGWCGGSGIVEIHFATVWDGLKWHLRRRLPILAPWFPVRIAHLNDPPPTSPEGT